MPSPSQSSALPLTALRRWRPVMLVVAVLLAGTAGLPLPGRGESGDRVAHPPIPSGRIVLLGDSITYSGGYAEWLELWLRLRDPEARIDVVNLGLPSETASGLSEPGHAGGAFPRPDVHERLERVLTKARPALVFACYGMNDGIYHPLSESRFERFRSGIERLHERVLASGARLVHLTPPVFDPMPLAGGTLPGGLAEYRSPYQGYDDVLTTYSEWLIGKRSQGWEVVDLHGPMSRFLAARRAEQPGFLLASDGVHANEQGHWLMAREILRHLGAPAAMVAADTPALLLAQHPRGQDLHTLVGARQRGLRDAWLKETGHKRPGMDVGRPLVEALHDAEFAETRIRRVAAARLPGRRTSWNGFDRYDLEVDGKPVLIVAPLREAPGRPWVWHGEFFGHRPEPDIALLGRGFHIVYMAIPDMLGSPIAVAHWNALYRELTERHAFSTKPALVGLSRGGLYCYNWAIANPEKVGCIYGDAPVCDFKSWPGGKGTGTGSLRDWQLVLERFGFTSETDALAYRDNPVDRLAPLAAAGVPLLHVYGDADEVVPWEENTGIVAERYRQLGGRITLIAKPGVGHHPHGLDDPAPIVEFIRTNALASAPASDPGPVDDSGRPLIRKLGTADLDLVECTPVVFQGRLLLFEWVRDGYWNNGSRTNHFRFVDPASGRPVSPPFAEGYEFGSAFVHDDTLLVTGTRNRSQVDLFVSRDLRTWDLSPVIPAGRYGIFNTSLCRTETDFVMMFEIDRPADEAGTAFTARFARSPDARQWTVTPPECQYSKDRYTAPHAIRWHEGWFYNFYLEAHEGYEMRVVRSRDLVAWEPSPLNPVLRASPPDRLPAHERFTEVQRRRLADAVNLNNSDLDFCEWKGRLMMTYSWGNQLGIEHLATATYDGTLDQFLHGWFPQPAPRAP